jgi:hypothetical protein
MEVAGTRYELRVGTLVSEATLATFQVPMRPTAVPRNTVYRLRVRADRDLSEVLHLLTERAVQVLEIRRCPERRPRNGRPAGQVPRPPTGEAARGGPRGVVVPFPRRTAVPPA